MEKRKSENPDRVDFDAEAREAERVAREREAIAEMSQSAPEPSEEE